MQSHSLSLLILLFLGVFTLIGCQQDIEPSVEITPADLSRVGTSSTCNNLQYADTIFYYRDQAGEYIESPKKSSPGTYGASPKGLSIDPGTGQINVNNSESGLKYKVWYTTQGSKDSCITYVTVSGINYRSRLYTLASGDSYAVPFYNGEAGLTSPCGDGKGKKKKSDCEFANDNDSAILALLNANGKQKKPKGVEIDSQSGVIDLRKAVDNGIFGTNPVDGTMVTFRLYYRVNDASKKAVNYIDLRLHYYSRASSVPSNLLDLANYKTTATFRHATPMPVVGAVLSTSGDESTKVRPARPPDIIIVGD